MSAENTIHEVSFHVASEVKQRIQLKDGVSSEELLRDLESGAIRTSLPVVTDQFVEETSLEVKRFHSDGSEETIGLVTSSQHVQPEIQGFNLDDNLTEPDGAGEDEVGETDDE